MKRYNDSIAAYKEGLEKFPDDAGLLKGLDSVEREKTKPAGGGAAGGGGGLGGLFSPQMMAQMALNPKTRPYLNDPDVMGKIKLIQDNPQLAPTMLQSDPRLMSLLSAMMGVEEDDDDEEMKEQSHSPPKRKGTRTNGGRGGRIRRRIATDARRIKSQASEKGMPSRARWKAMNSTRPNSLKKPLQSTKKHVNSIQPT